MKPMSKGELMLVLDTVAAYPSYKQICETYSKEFEGLVPLLNEPVQMEKYDAASEKINNRFFKRIKTLVDKRLSKFEITEELALKFFENVYSIRDYELPGVYSISTEDGCPDYSKLKTAVEQIDVLGKIQPRGFECYVPDGETSFSLRRTREFQMAYFSQMINKLNPVQIEVTIPVDPQNTCQSSCPVGYLLDFDGEMVVNGNLTRTGMVTRGKMKINGDLNHINSYSSGLSLEVNGNVTNVDCFCIDELFINGDVAQAKISNFYNSIKINGNVSELYFKPIPSKLKDDELKKLLGRDYKLYKEFKREKFEIGGDVNIFHNS